MATTGSLTRITDSQVSGLDEIVDTIYSQANDERGYLMSRLMQQQGLKLAFAGDSIMAGVGANNSVYGEANKEEQNFSYLFTNQFRAVDPNFVSVKDCLISTTGKLTNNRSGRLHTKLYKWPVDSTPSVFRVRTGTVMKKVASITMYYYASQSADIHEDFNVTVKSTTGTVLKTETVTARLTAYQDGNGASHTRQPVVKKHTIDLTGVSLPASVNIECDNVHEIVGFTTGKGVDMLTVAVSSTTLLNDSPANQTRGVTTDGQLQKVIDYKPDIVFMNWGTNDSKGGSNPVYPVADYEAEYVRRIAQLKTAIPNAVICLVSPPTGRSGSQYEGNLAYARAMKSAARTGGALYMPYNEAVARADDGQDYQLGNQSIYSDDVHPSVQGHMFWLGLACAMFGVTPSFKLDEAIEDTAITNKKYTYHSEQFNNGNASGAGENATATLGLVHEFDFDTGMSDDVDKRLQFTMTMQVGASPTVGSHIYGGSSEFILEISGDGGTVWTPVTDLINANATQVRVLDASGNITSTYYAFDTAVGVSRPHEGDKATYKVRVRGSRYYLRSLDNCSVRVTATEV